MAIRILYIEGPRDCIPQLTVSEEVTLRTIDLGNNQRVVGFKPETGISGYIHTGPPQPDFSQIVEIRKGAQTIVKLLGVAVTVEGF